MIGTKNTLLLALALLAASAVAQQSKDLEQSAAVTAEQSIVLDGFRSADLVVRTWDQPRVEVKLTVRVEMSSSDAEDEYIREVTLEKSESTGKVIFKLELPSVDVGLTFKNLLKMRFNTYVKNEIQGEIYLPRQNNFLADAKYGKLDIEGLDGSVEIRSQSSLIDIRSCSRLESVENNYGTTTIEASGGHLLLENKSGKVDIRTFEGSLKLNTRYSAVTAQKVTGRVDVESQSGSVTLQGIGSDVVVDAPYSTVVVENVEGSATVKDKSGSVKVTNVKGLEVDAPYSTIDATDVKGAPSRAVIVTGQSGKVSLARVSSAVDVQSPYTNIDLTDIGGDVRLGTKSGTVRASNVRGNWSSMTEYSRLTITDLSAKRVAIENKSGGIDIDLAIVPESVEIMNQYADVAVSLPKGLDAEVRLKAEYGKISSDLSVKTETMGSGALSLGKAGSGKGTLNIETKSGSIRVREK